MFSTYVLLSLKDRKTYTGSTDNLARRIREHNEGKNKSTKHRRSLILIYKEEYDTLLQARQREKYFKSASGRRFLKKVLNNV